MFGKCREQRAHITGDGLHCMTVSSTLSAVRRHICRQTKSYWKWITVAPCSSSRWANRGTCNEQNTPSVHSVGKSKRGEATNEHTVSRYHNRNRAHETEWKASSFWAGMNWVKIVAWVKMEFYSFANAQNRFSMERPIHPTKPLVYWWVWAESTSPRHPKCVCVCVCLPLQRCHRFPIQSAWVIIPTQRRYSAESARVCVRLSNEGNLETTESRVCAAFSTTLYSNANRPANRFVLCCFGCVWAFRQSLRVSFRNKSHKCVFGRRRRKFGKIFGDLSQNGELLDAPQLFREVLQSDFMVTK